MPRIIFCGRPESAVHWVARNCAFAEEMQKHKKIAALEQKAMLAKHRLDWRGEGSFEGGEIRFISAFVMLKLTRRSPVLSYGVPSMGMVSALQTPKRQL